MVVADCTLMKLQIAIGGHQCSMHLLPQPLMLVLKSERTAEYGLRMYQSRAIQDDRKRIPDDYSGIYIRLCSASSHKP